MVGQQDLTLDLGDLDGGVRAGWVGYVEALEVGT